MNWQRNGWLIYCPVLLVVFLSWSSKYPDIYRSVCWQRVCNELGSQMNIPAKRAEKSSTQLKDEYFGTVQSMAWSNNWLSWPNCMSVFKTCVLSLSLSQTPRYANTNTRPLRNKIGFWGQERKLAYLHSVYLWVTLEAWSQHNYMICSLNTIRNTNILSGLKLNLVSYSCLYDFASTDETALTWG